MSMHFTKFDSNFWDIQWFSHSIRQQAARFCTCATMPQMTQRKQKSFPIKSSACTSSLNFFTRWKDTEQFPHGNTTHSAVFHTKNVNLTKLYYLQIALLQGVRLRIGFICIHLVVGISLLHMKSVVPMFCTEMFSVTCVYSALPASYSLW